MVNMSWFCNIWSCSTWNSRKKFNISKNRKKSWKCGCLAIFGHVQLWFSREKFNHSKQTKNSWNLSWFCNFWSLTLISREKFRNSQFAVVLQKVVLIVDFTWKILRFSIFLTFFCQIIKGRSALASILIRNIEGLSVNLTLFDFEITSSQKIVK